MAKLTKEKVASCMKSSALTLATLFGVIGGVIFGLCLRQRERKLILIVFKLSIFRIIRTTNVIQDKHISQILAFLKLLTLRI